MNDYKQQSIYIKFRDMKSYSRFINTKHDPSKLEFIARPAHIKGEGDQFSFFAKSMHDDDDERIEHCAII